MFTKFCTPLFLVMFSEKTVKEINYLMVNQWCNFVWPLCIWGMKFCYLLCFRHNVNGFPKVIHHLQVGDYQAQLFTNENLVLQIVRLQFYSDFLVYESRLVVLTKKK